MKVDYENEQDPNIAEQISVPKITRRQLLRNSLVLSAVALSADRHLAQAQTPTPFSVTCVGEYRLQSWEFQDVNRSDQREINEPSAILPNVTFEVKADGQRFAKQTGNDGNTSIRIAGPCNAMIGSQPAISSVISGRSLDGREVTQTVTVGNNRFITVRYWFKKELAPILTPTATPILPTPTPFFRRTVTAEDDRSDALNEAIHLFGRAITNQICFISLLVAGGLAAIYFIRRERRVAAEVRNDTVQELRNRGPSDGDGGRRPVTSTPPSAGGPSIPTPETTPEATPSAEETSPGRAMPVNPVNAERRSSVRNDVSEMSDHRLRAEIHSERAARREGRPPRHSDEYYQMLLNEQRDRNVRREEEERLAREARERREREDEEEREREEEEEERRRREDGL